MSTVKHSQQGASFLQLPTEIRLQIIDLCLGEHTFHIITVPDSDSTGKPVLRSIGLVRQDCGAMTRHRLPGLTATCRQLFIESNPILYRNTTMVFDSVQSMDCFFQNNHTVALASVQCLMVRCGPAKHTSRDEKAQYRRAFDKLNRHAHALRALHLAFDTYYNIHRDQRLLSNFWFHRLVRLRHLSAFSLHVNLELCGPVNYATPMESTRLRDRVLCANQVIQTLLAQKDRGQTGKQNVQRVQEDILTMVDGRHTGPLKSIPDCS